MKKKSKMKQPLSTGSEPEVSSLDGWRGGVIQLELGSRDLRLLDNVLCLAPELRIVVSLAQEAQRRGLTYPVATAGQLVELLKGAGFELGGHCIDSKTISRAMAKQWFPLGHEGEFLSAVYLALIRCRSENTARVFKKFQRMKKAKKARSTQRG